MNLWMDKYCPSFMCVPHKPHPFGNEYHFIADGDQGRAILWRVELVEGKDWPKLANGAWEFPCKYEVVGELKTAEWRFWTLIKKQGQYWPQSVPGDDIDTYFEGKELGETMLLEQEIEMIKFLIHCMMDKSYKTKLMSTHGMLNEIQDLQTV
ncbi:hypothetical protein ACHAXS_000102 [Conticribra weissflogii]